MNGGYQLDRAGLSYGPAVVLEEVSLSIENQGLVLIVGPNGAGKSSLLSILAGLRRAYAGSSQYAGRELRSWDRGALSREVAFVPQSLRLDFPFTAEQVVLMGRTPYAGGLFESETDWAVTEEAMQMTDTLKFRDRDFRTLSGGERQRVVLASALAQQPNVLLLDEPTTFLDLRHQISTYGLLRELTRKGLLVISVTHDLNLAMGYADRVIGLKMGRVCVDGPPAAALTPDSIQAMFGVPTQLLARPGGRAWVSYGE